MNTPQTLQEIIDYFHERGYYGTTREHQNFTVFLLRYIQELEYRVNLQEEWISRKQREELR